MPRFQCKSRWGIIGNGEFWCNYRDLPSVLNREMATGNTVTIYDHDTSGVFQCLESSEVPTVLAEIDDHEKKFVAKTNSARSALIRFIDKPAALAGASFHVQVR